MHETPDYPGTPRWVKITAGIAVVVVILVILLLHLGGPGDHGPGLHLSDAASLGTAATLEAGP